MIYEVNNIGDLYDLFPKTPEQIREYKKKSVDLIENQIKKILEIPNEKRTFQNTAKAYDYINYFFHPIHSTLQALEFISPKNEIREVANQQITELNNFYIDKVSNNLHLYKAFKNYVEHNAENETLTKEQKYFLDQIMLDFKKNGLDLSHEQIDAIKKLNKEIAQICLQFETNIAQHKCEVIVTAQELNGLSDEFISSLKRNEEGKYILGCDYPTYFNVMDNCHVESTRKQLWLAFVNRAYPVNMQLLNELINKRDQLAQLTGFNDYNSFCIENQMAEDTQKVLDFYETLVNKARQKREKEIETLKNNLPNFVNLTSDRKFNPWDMKFVKNYYKKQNLALDEQEIAKYFPLEHTIEQLLNIYQKFFGVKFLEIKTTGFWHEDVKLIEAYDMHSEKLLGYILLDLFPRDNKFSHAAHTTLISAINQNNNVKSSSVGVVIANFPKPTSEHEALLKFKDVQTFFHEFGHAVHALFGATEFYTFSGTNVKRDFVEMPSQMLEDWLHDEDILKLVSKHYKTGVPLNDDLIKKIRNLEKFDSGEFILQQIYYGLLSLSYYNHGQNKDTQSISERLYKEVLNHLSWDQQDHFQCSFGHLTDYGPSYYGYLWTKVYAKDLFHEIKKNGLLNQKMGRKYIEKVIGKGGSDDPNQLLFDFLDRKPEIDPFLSDFDLN